MNMEELFHLIELQPEAIGKLKESAEQINIREIDTFLLQLMKPDTAPQAYNELFSRLPNDEDGFKMLCCQLNCAYRIWDSYQRKGISLQIYTETMKCFPRFLSENRQKYGRMLYNQGKWTYRQISMSLFRIGELEYEFRQFEGKNVISIHVPSDADFSPKSVDESLRKAEAFFNAYYKEYTYDQYICCSWLLSGSLQPLLSASSNILAFQKRFQIVDEDREGRKFIEWLFEVPADTDNEILPECTSLQKNVKKLLLKGGTIGEACGIMDRSKIRS